MSKALGPKVFAPDLHQVSNGRLLPAARFRFGGVQSAVRSAVAGECGWSFAVGVGSA